LEKRFAADQTGNTWHGTNIVENQNPREMSVKSKRPVSLEGIIARLTRKHAGKWHDKDSVTITSKPVDDDDDDLPQNVVDLNAQWYLLTGDEVGQWICWDFGKFRVSPTHYKTIAPGLQSRVVESLLDGENWTEIDRQTDKHALVDQLWTAFAVSQSATGRFTRRSQTGNGKVWGTNSIFMPWTSSGVSSNGRTKIPNIKSQISY
jgi:hypothetical protein